MTASRLSITLALTLLTFLLAASARANPHSIDPLAAQLQDQAGQLSAEICGNFRHAPNFPQLVSEAQQLYALSAQVRALSRARINPRVVEEIVHRIDRLVHCLEDRVDDADHFRGGRHSGHCDTRCAQRLLASIDRTVENLDDALHDLSQGGYQSRQQPRYDFEDGPGFQQPVPTGNPYYRNSGATFSGRGFSIQIGR